jgi:hypothetical protein
LAPIGRRIKRNLRSDLGTGSNGWIRFAIVVNPS